MAEYSFKTIEFEDKGSCIRAHFMRIFYFDIEHSKIYSAKEGKLAINLDKTAADIELKKLLDYSFSSLINKISKRKAIYVHKNSGIPLIGNIAFGIIDRNSSLVEIRPITSCNLDCIYCSVGGEKEYDFVVECDYLVEEFAKLAKEKGVPLEAHISTQGEALLYSDIVDLVRGLKAIPQVKKISMETNGMLLTRELADSLVSAGLDQFNLSINSLDEKKSKEIAGPSYNISHVMEIAIYISAKCKLVIAPVRIPKINEGGMGPIIEFAKELNATLGIQNFLNYKSGKNPARQLSWPKFYAILRDLEAKHSTKLILTAVDFGVTRTKSLPKPFKKGDIIDAQIVSPGRLKGEMIAASQNRAITVANCATANGKARIKLTGDKHNIFYGAIVKR